MATTAETLQGVIAMLTAATASPPASDALAATLVQVLGHVKAVAAHTKRQSASLALSRQMSMEVSLDGLFRVAAAGAASCFNVPASDVHIFMAVAGEQAASTVYHDVATPEGLQAYLSALTAQASAHLRGGDSEEGDDDADASAAGAAAVPLHATIQTDVAPASAASAPQPLSPAAGGPPTVRVSSIGSTTASSDAASATVSPGGVTSPVSDGTPSLSTPASNATSLPPVTRGKRPSARAGNVGDTASPSAGMPLPALHSGITHASSTTGTVIHSTGDDDSTSLPKIALRRVSNNLPATGTTGASPHLTSRPSTSAMMPHHADSSFSLDGGADLTGDTPMIEVRHTHAPFPTAVDVARKVIAAQRGYAMLAPPEPVASPPASAASRPTTPGHGALLPAIVTGVRRSTAGIASPPTASKPLSTLRASPSAESTVTASAASGMVISDSAVSLQVPSALSVAGDGALPPLGDATAAPDPRSLKLAQRQSSSYSHATLVPEPDHSSILSPQMGTLPPLVENALPTSLRTTLASSRQFGFASSATTTPADLGDVTTATNRTAPRNLGLPPLPSARDDASNLGLSLSSSLTSSSFSSTTRDALIVGAPIPSEDASAAAIGAVVVVTSSPRTSGLSMRDIELVDTIATALSTAHRRVVAVEDARAAERRAYGLVQMVKAVSHETAVPAIIVRIIDVAYDLLAADRVSVFRVDAERHELLLSVSEDAAGLRIPMDKGIVGYVATTGELLNIPDAYDNPLFDRSFDQKTSYRTKSVLCMPVKAPGGHVVAVIQAINKAGGTAFTLEDERTLSVVADTAGVTLHKAQLLADAEMARRASAALADVVRIVNESEGAENENVEGLIDSLVSVAYRLVEADRITLFLVDALKNELFCQVSQDLEDMRRIRIPIGKGIAGMVASTAEIVNIADAYSDARFNKDADVASGYHTRSILCMPLRLRQSGRVVGVVQAINKRGGPFSHSDEELLEAWSTEVGIVIDRKSLQLVYDKMVADGAGADDEAGKLTSFLTQFVKSAAPPGAPARGARASALGPGFTPGVMSSRKMSGVQTPMGIPSAASLLSLASSRRGLGDMRQASQRGFSHRLSAGSPPSSLNVSLAGGDSIIVAASVSASGGSSRRGSGTVMASGSSTVQVVLPATSSSSPAQSARPDASAPVVTAPPVVDTATAIVPPLEHIPEAPEPSTGDTPSHAHDIAAGANGQSLTPHAAAESATAVLSALPADAAAAASVTEAASNAAPPLQGTESSATALPEAVVASPDAAVSPRSTQTPGRQDSPVHLITNAQDAEDALLRPWLFSQPREGRERMANEMTEWSFDVLQHDDIALCAVFMDMCHHFDLPREFHLQPDLVATFLDDVRTNYRENPYHNFKHGMSVAHMCFIAMHRTRAAAMVLSPLDRLATLIASLCHDIDHPGVTNAFEMNALTDFAVLYNDVSVLENHHAARMFQLLRAQETRRVVRTLAVDTASPDARANSSLSAVQSPVTSVEEEGVSMLGLTRPDFAAFRRQAIAGILATDMTHHNSLTDQARRLTPDSALEMSSKTMIELLIHSADLSNPVLPAFSVVQKWAVMVCSEFTAQVQREKAAGLPFAPHMDGLATPLAIAKLQVGFIGYVVSPLWTSVAAGMTELAPCVENMTRNRAAWQAIVDGTAPPEHVAATVPPTVVVAPVGEAPTSSAPAPA